MWRGLRSAAAARGSNCGGACSVVGTTRRYGQSSQEEAFLPRGKDSVEAKDLSPKEATQMSRDSKYIGMDVHKEAIVMAVLNGRGKQVMESIIETQASSIPQFIHGLGGELQSC